MYRSQNLVWGEYEVFEIGYHYELKKHVHRDLVPGIPPRCLDHSFCGKPSSYSSAVILIQHENGSHHVPVCRNEPELSSPAQIETTIPNKRTAP